MNYIKIDNCDFNNGEGCRVVLWVAGCENYCEGCHNQETWDYKAGKPFTAETMDEITKLVSNPFITGLTITGGDPMAPKNRDEVFALMFFIKYAFPNKDIWVWTGHKLEEVEEYLYMADTVIDGKYEKDNPTTKPWRGSDNQKMWINTGGGEFKYYD